MIMKLPNNKFYRFLFLYFLTFGASAFMLLTISLFIDKINFENMLRAFAIGFIAPTTLNILWFSKTPDIVELWIKRIYYCIISMGWISACISVFNNGFNLYKFTLSFGVGLAVTLILGIPVWLIADRRQKKKLEEINLKLQENQNA